MNKKGILLITGTVIALLSGVIAFYEYRTHHMLYILDAARICKMDDKLKQDYTIIGAWAASLSKLELDIDVAFIGDSHIQGSNFHKAFPDKKIITLGVGGNRVDMVEDRLLTVVAVKPKKLFVQVGINDLHRSDAETVALRYEDLMIKLKSLLPKTQIFIQSILPVNSEKEKHYSPNSEVRKANEYICQLSRKYGFTYIDLYSKFESDGLLPDSLTVDGVHLNNAGYKIWADEIAEYVR